MIWQSQRDTKKTAKEAKHDLVALEKAATATSIKEFLEENYPRQYDMLFDTTCEDGHQTVESNPDSILHRWLSQQPATTQRRTLEELQNERLDTMSRSERYSLYGEWTRQIQEQCVLSLLESQKLWQVAKSRQNLAYSEIDARCLAQANIIGVTTSGMASHMDVLGKVNAKVIICEEAGEVLESHLLTALLPTIEHVILIGDHLQLRPRISRALIVEGNSILSTFRYLRD